MLQSYVTTQYHLIGSAALGEVVDWTLRVNVVKRLRVVDAGSIPAHVSGSGLASTYAVAEEGTNQIKEAETG